MNQPLFRSIDWAALARYLSGESEPGEAEAIRRWIDASPDRRAMVKGLERAWAEAAAVPRQEWNTEEAVRRIMDKVPPASLVSKGRASRPWLRRTILAAAAVAVLAVGLTLWRPAFIQSLPAMMLGMREYVTPRGQYTTLTLLDGTRITLAPLSRLRVPRNLNSPVRTVYLDGQALFEVTHDTTRAFHVHTARSIATDLGTTFVVRAYADMPDDEVVVTQGSVSLTPRSSPSASAALDSLLLHPGDLGRVGPDGALSAERGVSTDEYTAWSNGRLVFHRASLREVAVELARWYDIEVRISDSATAARRVTVSFDGQPASDVLRYVALSLGLQYELQGRIIVLTPMSELDKVKP